MNKNTNTATRSLETVDAELDKAIDAFIDVKAKIKAQGMVINDRDETHRDNLLKVITNLKAEKKEIEAAAELAELAELIEKIDELPDNYEREDMKTDARNNNLSLEQFDERFPEYEHAAIVRLSITNGQHKQARKQCERYGLHYEHFVRVNRRRSLGI